MTKSPLGYTLLAPDGSDFVDIPKLWNDGVTNTESLFDKWAGILIPYPSPQATAPPTPSALPTISTRGQASSPTQAVKRSHARWTKRANSQTAERSGQRLSPSATRPSR